MFSFDGKSVTDPEFGVVPGTVRTVFPLLPGVRDGLIEIPGMDGAYDMGADREPLRFTVYFLIRRDTPGEMLQSARSVAAWLNVREPRQFIRNQEPDKFYMARLQGTAGMDRILASGGYCSVPFIAPDPYAYAVTAKTVTFPLEPGVKAVNAGSTACPCTIAATLDDDVDFLKITLAETGEFIHLNRALSAGDEILIDTGQRLVAVNGADARADVTYLSSYFMLPPGEFTLISDPDIPLTVTFRERWA